VAFIKKQHEYLRKYFFVFCGKTFTPPRHKDAKMNINQKVTRFALCLGAFVAICSPPVADPGEDL
jgi:hypothetical protein